MAINYGSLQATLTPRGVVSGKVQNATRAFVKDYDLLENKPKVNGVELSGDKSLDDLGIEIPEIVANPSDTTENLTSIGIDGVNYNIQGSGGNAVTSVNGKTGDVTLDAEDVGALPDDTPIPSELADLSEDSTHRTVTDTEKQTWDNKSDFSGSYNDLEDKPDIPDELSDLTDDSTHRLVTDTEKTAWNAKADISDLPTVNNSTITIQKNNQNVDSFTLNQDSNKSINISVPTKTSDLQNDNSFITNTVNNLANYYLKTQTYTQAEVDALIQATVNGRFQKVNTLPASGEPNVIYLVPKTTPETSNACDEYIWQDNAWELIGSTEIDLSDYVTDEDLATTLQDYLTTSAFATAIANYYTKTEVGTLLDNKVDKIPGKGLSTNDYDNTAKAIVDSVTANLATKVDKVPGKGLSTNDYDNTAKGIVDGVTNALAGKANISEMSVTDGTGADADKTTIQLKSGTSATVLKTHQDISGKADKVTGATNGNLAGLDANGNLTDSGVAKTDIDDMKDELSTDSATVEGNPINFSTLSAQNAESTIIDLEPIQDLHGYDYPWVGGTGANKWNEEWEVGGLVPETGEETVATNRIRSKGYTPIEANTNYYFQAPFTSDNIRICYYDANKDFVSSTAWLRRGVFTTPQDVSYLRFYIGTSYGTTYNNDLAINYPSTVTTYSPYENICAITGRTQVGIEGCGKNLVNWKYNLFGENRLQITLSQGTYTISPQSQLSSGNMYIRGTKNSGEYCSKTELGVDTWGNSSIAGTYYKDGNGVVTFNVPENNVLIEFGKLNTDGSISAQLEKNNQPTAYSPYTVSNSLTIAFGQTVYGGQVDVEKGVLVVDRKLVDMSIFSWIDNTVSGYQRFRTANVISDAITPQSDTDKIQCSCIEINNNPISQTSGNGLLIHTNGYLYVRYEQVDNVTNFISAVTGQTICYTLATPITINLTPHQISLLEGVNNISTTADGITLTYRDGKVAILGDLKELREYVDSKPSGGGHNYSTEEQVIGTWIDGSAVYEKCFEIDIQTNGSEWVDTGVAIPNIKNIVKYDIVGIDRNVSNAPANIQGLVRYYNSNLQIFIVANWYVTLKVGVVQYTKTTA